MKIKRVRSAGFTLVELMTVTGVMGMLVAMAVPNFVRSRASSQTRICIINLNKIEWAKQTWGLENAKSLAETPTAAQLYGITGYLREEPHCPSGGTYDVRPLNLNATCTEPGHGL